ncbi:MULTISPECIES: ParB/Srx family N-terminal domain-containing protein [unclassified Pseudomonas]|uniref:ParB/Srx family N-terminal domain-containing protein n=1 Tax=unclassified Pseudomonas TaxID=196821 RepID=UPI0011BE4CD9|nr:MULTISPECIES: ParB/Srx family N-terminal domain-containing protein [unclassified Pseudomonas]
MTLKLREHPLFWATLEHSHYGAWLVRNVGAAEPWAPPFPAIRSADVGRFAGLPPIECMRSWCRYFVERLSAPELGFLIPGQWVVQALLPVADTLHARGRLGAAEWHFKTASDDTNRLPDWQLSGSTLLRSLQAGSLRWIDFSDDREALIVLHDVDPYADRLKWWRKKAREGTLPPILLWYVAGLSAFVVIDGHHRLHAAIMENAAPRFVVIAASRSQTISHCPEIQQRVLASLSRPRARRLNLDVAASNRVLIQAFDDRPCLGALTHGWASPGEERAWIDEVGQRVQHIGKTEHLQNIIDRCEPDTE